MSVDGGDSVPKPQFHRVLYLFFQTDIRRNQAYWKKIISASMQKGRISIFRGETLPFSPCFNESKYVDRLWCSLSVSPLIGLLWSYQKIPEIACETFFYQLANDASKQHLYRSPSNYVIFPPIYRWVIFEFSPSISFHMFLSNNHKTVTTYEFELFFSRDKM